MREEKAPTDEEFRRDLNGLIGFLIIGMILATIIVFFSKRLRPFFLITIAIQKLIRQKLLQKQNVNVILNNLIRVMIKPI